MKIQIKSWLNGEVLFEHEGEQITIKDAVKEAVNSGADLRDANLRDAYLIGAYLRDAYLRDADLTGAYLRGAYLTGADLRDANLRDANLRDADLTGADLTGANLIGAYLTGADLRDANLRDADLTGADLQPIKQDMFDVLLRAIPEIPNLKKAMVEGRIDGSTYEGDCACLCGTLMKSENGNIVNKVDKIKNGSRPIERFFLGIKKGDTPENNHLSKIAYEWIEEFEVFIEAR